MLLRHLEAILPPHDSKKLETAIAWSPNNLKLAVTSANCLIYLFDDKCVRKDEFSTKALNARNHIIKGLAFSPDSTKLAVGHTDGFVKFYNIGEEWGKKSVEFELHQGSAVTCLTCPSEQLIVVGLENGKVNTIAITTRMITILCDTSSTTIALATNSRGTGILSSHADGKINRYHITDTGMIEFSGQAIVHHVGAHALAWTHHNYILAGGRDRRLVFYDSRGKSHQVFSFCGNLTPEGITVACCSPSGQNVAIGTWDGMRILNLSPRTTLWEDTVLTTLPKGGPVIALAWRGDGSQLVVGGLNGGVEQYEVTLRSPSTFGATGYEVLYIEPTLAIVSSLGDEHSKPIVIRSRANHEIEDVKLLGNHIIARTAATLIICELNSDLVSEIPRDNEKEMPLSSIKLTVESTREQSCGEKVTQNISEICKSSIKDYTLPKQMASSVSFDKEHKHIDKNGISPKTCNLADLMISRSSQTIKSKYSQPKNKDNESDNSLLSNCSLGFSEMRNKSENGSILCKDSANDDDAKKEKVANRRTNTNNMVYSTVKGDAFCRNNASSAKSAEKERDKIINISSNRKTCKYTTEDSVCWTLSLDSRSSGQVSENEAEQDAKNSKKSRQRQIYPETTGLNLAPSSTASGPLVQNANEFSYATAVDQSHWRNNSMRKDYSKIDRINSGNCEHPDANLQECSRCNDVYKPWTHNNEQLSSMSSTPEIPLPGLTASSPIRFTRQYTPEELRGDFSLQLAVMASLPPGLQRVLEKQALTEEKN